MFDTLIVLLKVFFKKLILKKVSRQQQHESLPSIQRVKPACTVSYLGSYKYVCKQTSPGLIAQLVMYLNADPGIASLIPAWSQTFVEIDYEIISTAILLTSADSRRLVVCYKRNYVHKVLVILLAKFAQEKSVVSPT